MDAEKFICQLKSYIAVYLLFVKIFLKIFVVKYFVYSLI